MNMTCIKCNKDFYLDHSIPRDFGRPLNYCSLCYSAEKLINDLTRQVEALTAFILKATGFEVTARVTAQSYPRAEIVFVDKNATNIGITRLTAGLIAEYHKTNDEG